MNKVLVIAPHMDDEVLGGGGVIARHKDNGDKVSVIFIAYRTYNHTYDAQKNNIEKAHALKAKEALQYDEAFFLNLSDERLDMAVQDIIIPLEQHFDDIRPDTIYIPFSGDNNQDHRAVYNASRVVLRPSATLFLNRVYMYEVPSSTDQSPPLPENIFYPNYYVNISSYIDRKITALNCYETERREFPHPRSEKGLRVLAQKRGMEIGFEYAEAFMILREKWQ